MCLGCLMMDKKKTTLVNSRSPKHNDSLIDNENEVFYILSATTVPNGPLYKLWYKLVLCYKKDKGTFKQSN